MALRRHLPRFWLIATLGGVAALCGYAYWWEQQLPGRLREAASREDLEACLRYGEQLAALRWLDREAPSEQAVCRRRQAELAWKGGDSSQALTLQSQLVNSNVGSEEQRRKDRSRLLLWRQTLRERALDQFRAGDLKLALTTLQPLEHKGQRPGTQLSDSLRETWNRNQVDHERLRDKVQRQQWWEALSVLNQLDHPWWQDHALPLRRQVEEAIQNLRDRQEHHSHGALPAHTVDPERLNTAVEERLSSGMDPWSAFVAGCADLGGVLVEEGPESLCKAKRR
ncbi:hypothetical protein SynMITS9220_02508 [Synechococcus sp. MIT S9220]|uniref:hypothetical protein n=1 Tax=unclassified Synechococcus TaxID=2626047 RepID=UPI00164BCDDC|nr:hypothetical protein [Synechococcus sp. MIT S9220]NOL46148.1 hypothetical protein [Synechococcus sp. MIT S9220]QNJ23792.1 hypothetical protein SynMITS9220_02508 [Synechococcus sp. MIT S9220]